MTRKKAYSWLRTDSGNAEMFASFYGDNVKFDHKQGRWLMWNQEQGRWVEDSQGKVRGLMTRAARQQLRSATRAPESEERKKQISWSLQSENWHRIDAALALAKSLAPISDDGEGWDSDPWLFGVKSGIVDLRSGRLRKPRPEGRVTLFSPVAYDRTARCPRFEKFILEICDGDPELVSFIQRAVGYTLTGHTDEQCFFCCYGTGANGKSTLLGVLHYILGDYAVNLPFSALELKDRSSIPNDVVMLAGRRFGTAIETRESVRLNEARIKALTGGDAITARHLYHEHFTFAPTHKLWLAFNHKPRIEDESEGMWRRVRLIPFNSHFSADEMDKRLLDTLKAEAPGILAWAVRGALLWQKEGLGEPKSVVNATAAYREESDQLEHFIADCCTIAEEDKVAKAALFEKYQKWVQDNGEAPLSSNAFSDRLRQRGFKDHRLGHSGTRGWRGIGLRDPTASVGDGADQQTVEIDLSELAEMT